MYIIIISLFSLNLCFLDLFKGYYNNIQETREAVSQDGWLLTGDVFYVDDFEEVHYVERKKLWFKYLNYHVSETN